MGNVMQRHFPDILHHTVYHHHTILVCLYHSHISSGEPAPYAAGTGSVPVTPDRAAFDRMGYRERLALKRENPEVYQEMKK